MWKTPQGKLQIILHILVFDIYVSLLEGTMFIEQMTIYWNWEVFVTRVLSSDFLRHLGTQNFQISSAKRGKVMGDPTIMNRLMMFH